MLNRIPARILQRLAIGLLVLYPLAVILARFDVWDFRNSFLIFIITALFSFLVLVLSVLKLPKKQEGEATALVVAIVCTLLPLLVLGSNIVKARSVPFIHDVTTDVSNPPVLEAAKSDREAGHHPVEYAGEDIAKLQQEGYPDIQPLELNQPVETVLAKAMSVVKDMGWEVLAVNDQEAPFTIEAVATSALFGFEDDVVIRLTPFTTPQQNVDMPAKTRVDVRSMSRVGQSDLGANAARIQVILNALRDTQ